jgi:hypothetical protein
VDIGWSLTLTRELRKTQVSVIGGGGVWGGGMQKFKLFIGSSMVSNFDINRLQMFQLEEIRRKNLNVSARF